MSQHPQRQSQQAAPIDAPSNVRRNLFSSHLSRRAPVPRTNSGFSPDTSTHIGLIPNQRITSNPTDHLSRPHLAHARSQDRQILLLSPSGSFHLDAPPPLTPYSAATSARWAHGDPLAQSNGRDHEMENTWYRGHQAPTESAAEKHARITNGLLAAVRSLDADAWMFGDETVERNDLDGMDAEEREEGGGLRGQG